MKNVLLVQSSILKENSQSNILTEKLVERIKDIHLSSQVVVRNVAGNEIPHLDSHRLAALSSEAENRNKEQQNIVAFADELLSEVIQADVIVLAVPMYNFGVPSQLKAWFDHLARAGITFRYTANGPVGLLEDKPVYVISTRGGFYEGGNGDFLTPYIKQYLEFIGLTQVKFVFSEGLNISPQQKQASIEKTLSEIDLLIHS
jgi:FMN-dependent NADH-azoreductase